MDETEKFLQTTYREYETKFDYFILGVVGALFAYLAQTTDYTALGETAKALEFLSLALLLVSGVFGMLRIEQIILSVRANIEARNGTKVDLPEISKKSRFYYRARNCFLLFAFAAVGLSKLANAYAASWGLL